MDSKIFLIGLALFAVALFICFGFFMVGIGWCSPTGTFPDSVSLGTVVYTCPMHPEIQQNEPGQCPKCGMDLVLKENPGKESIESPMKDGHDHNRSGKNGHDGHNTGHKHKGC